jgi:hypothetical protein
VGEGILTSETFDYYYTEVYALEGSHTDESALLFLQAFCDLYKTCIGVSLWSCRGSRRGAFMFTEDSHSPILYEHVTTAKELNFVFQWVPDVRTEGKDWHAKNPPHLVLTSARTRKGWYEWKAYRRHVNPERRSKHIQSANTVTAIM